MREIQPIITPITETGLKFLAYKRYQMDWMSRKNIGLDDIWRVMKEIAVERATCGDSKSSDMSTEFDKIWQELCYDRGFHGEMYACYDEFLTHEYQDAAYMQEILSKKEYETYCKYQAIQILSDSEKFAQTHTATECLKAYVIHEAAYLLDKELENLDKMDGIFINDLVDESERWINEELLSEMTADYEQRLELLKTDEEEEK